MGNCCRRREDSSQEQGWADYRDSADFIPPSTARERRERPGTTSMSDEQLQEMTEDSTRPRKAAHAAAELQRRGLCQTLDARGLLPSQRSGLRNALNE